MLDEVLSKQHLPSEHLAKKNPTDFSGVAVDIRTQDCRIRSVDDISVLIRPLGYLNLKCFTTVLKMISVWMFHFSNERNVRGNWTQVFKPHGDTETELSAAWPKGRDWLKSQSYIILEFTVVGSSDRMRRSVINIRRIRGFYLINWLLIEKSFKFLLWCSSSN